MPLVCHESEVVTRGGEGECWSGEETRAFRWDRFSWRCLRQEREISWRQSLFLLQVVAVCFFMCSVILCSCNLYQNIATQFIERKGAYCMRSGNMRGKYHLQPRGLSAHILTMLTLSSGPNSNISPASKSPWQRKFRVLASFIMVSGAPLLWTKSLSVKPCASSEVTIYLNVCEWSPCLINPAVLRSIPLKSDIKSRISFFLSGKCNLTCLITWICRRWSAATCYLCCQHRRKRGRLDKVKKSGLLKFKVLKWPLINTSDGAKAVIFENNSKIILPHNSCLSPQANTDTLGSDRTRICYKSDAKFD